MTNQVFLASKSPRRNQLLTWAGFDVRVIASNNHTLYAFEGDEELQPAELPEPYVRRTALNKFREGLALRAKLYPENNEGVVLAADTVVSLGDTILGKPVDQTEAKAFVNQLSGQVHLVRTGVVVGRSETDCELIVQTSEVGFRELNSREIEVYTSSSEPYDKAGGYSIQGVGGLFVNHLSGSYSGVMGLPIAETAELLLKYGVSPTQSTTI